MVLSRQVTVGFLAQPRKSALGCRGKEREITPHLFFVKKKKGHVNNEIKSTEMELVK